MTAARWPWLSHRTLAEVARTDALIAKADAGREKFTHAETGNFGNLLTKARRFNPPPPPRPPEDAA
jgi:hypothetical protein